MKTLLKFVLVASIVLGFSLTSSAQETGADEFKVEVGFHCANGKKLLETKLAEVKGIESFVVDLETKVITFQFDSAIISKDQIVAEIENIGYYTEHSDKNKEIKKACSHGSGEHDHDQDHE